MMDKFNKKYLNLIISIVLIVFGSIGYILSINSTSQNKSTDKKSTITYTSTLAPTTMHIQSPTFPSGGYIPVEYTCKGQNLRPVIQISDVPTQVKSLALIMSDPDAPMGTFYHWVIWNIDPTTGIIESLSNPFGSVEGMNSAGGVGYVAPCPPSGTHNYVITVYALDTDLNTGPLTTAPQLLSMMEGKVLMESTITGLVEH